MKALSQQGMTIFEILLVLVIAAGIIALSLNQYQSLKFGSDGEKLRDTVNSIALAAANLYYAKCNPPLPSSSITSPFWDTSTTPPSPTGEYLVNIKTDLETAGYLRPQLPNPLVKQVGTDPYEGYTLRFEPVMTDRTVCLNQSSGSCTETKVVGQVVTWQIWLVVCLQNPSQANVVAGITNTTTIATHCNGQNSLDFWFLPSQVVAENSSNAAMTPFIQQFKQMYTTMPLTNLTGTAGAADDQYYYCGS